MDAPVNNQPGQPPAQPLYSNVQQVQPVDPAQQAEYAIHRTEQERRALAMRMGEVAARAATTGQPF